MDIGGLFKSACGAVTKVVKTVSKVAKIIVNVAANIACGNYFSALFQAAIGSLEVSAFVNDDEDIDIDEDLDEIAMEEFKLLVGAMLKEDWLKDPEGSMEGFEQSIQEFKKSDEPGNIIKSTDTFNWFREKTQKGDFPCFFDIGGFDTDENGVYHAQQDALQQYGGYTDLYDDVFDLGCSMDKQKFPFKVGDEEYIVWLWKGDYLNFGAGAETGIYKGGEPLWKCDTEDAMPMTLRLEDTSGNVIYDWKPDESKWWCTGFNPAYEDYNVKDLISIGTIDFSEHLDMWEAFKEQWIGTDIWEFDEENNIAEYKWKGKLNQ